MRILFETKNGKKYTWKATKWQRIVGYILTIAITIINVYLWFGYASINNL